MRKVLPLVAVVVVLGGAAMFQAAETKVKKPKYTIKQVMKTAHEEDGLRDKVLSGKAEKADKEKLLEMYIALSQNKPPKGSPVAWKKRTATIVAAAKSVVEDDKDGIARLTKATNCKSCHMSHRPPKE
jgi:hypothetical protein